MISKKLNTPFNFVFTGSSAAASRAFSWRWTSGDAMSVNNKKNNVHTGGSRKSFLGDVECWRWGLWSRIYPLADWNLGEHRKIPQRECHKLQLPAFFTQHPVRPLHVSTVHVLQSDFTKLQYVYCIVCKGVVGLGRGAMPSPTFSRDDTRLPLLY